MKTWFIILLLIGKGTKSMDYLDYLQKVTVSEDPVIQAAFDYQIAAIRLDRSKKKFDEAMKGELNESES